MVASKGDEPISDLSLESVKSSTYINVILNAFLLFFLAFFCFLSFFSFFLVLVYFCVLCAQCCLCLSIVHSRLPFWFSLTFICKQNIDYLSKLYIYIGVTLTEGIVSINKVIVCFPDVTASFNLKNQLKYKAKWFAIRWID